MTMFPPHLFDIGLIFISGFACLYCALLSRRLKALSNLKTGVGASIISLTEAITQTNKASKDAQNTTMQTVETLRHLIEKSEQAAPRIEALLLELDRVLKQVQEKSDFLDVQLNEGLTPAVELARKTAVQILQIIEISKIYRRPTDAKTIVKQELKKRPKSTLEKSSNNNNHKNIHKNANNNNDMAPQGATQIDDEPLLLTKKHALIQVAQ